MGRPSTAPEKAASGDAVAGQPLDAKRNRRESGTEANLAYCVDLRRQGRAFNGPSLRPGSGGSVEDLLLRSAPPTPARWLLR